MLGCTKSTNERHLVLGKTLMKNCSTALMSTFSLLLFCSFASAQDYTLSHLTGADSDIISAQEPQSASVGSGRLPSSLFEPEDDGTTPVVVGNVTEAHRLANYAVIAAFAALLVVGFAITGLCIHAKRRMRTAAPISMVSAHH